ncbi:MAG: 5'/3'-nucleotidase SurE [Mogibacterium sp.]|nr:5'/3'-nucleotidase SurE [Mogibacterium sp.]
MEKDKSKVKKVLVTNDDGIDAPGLLKLVEALEPIADVYVAAPMVQHSAKSQSITFRHEVDTDERVLPGAKAAWAVHGTPTDCVKIGISKMKEAGIKFDHVLSGVNLGYNSGLAVYYSGTVAAAREGELNGIRSIALSVGSHEATKFEFILSKLPELMDLADNAPEGFFLNVNAPDIAASEVKGTKIVPVAPFGYGLLFSYFPSEEKGVYHMDAELGWTNNHPVYDMDWNQEGYMTVTPIPTSVQADEAVQHLKAVVGQTDDSEQDAGPAKEPEDLSSIEIY